MTPAIRGYSAPVRAAPSLTAIRVAAIARSTYWPIPVASRRCNRRLAARGHRTDGRCVGSNRVWRSPNAPNPRAGQRRNVPPSALFFPSLNAVAQSDALRVVWRIVLRVVVPKVRKTEAVAVLRLHEGEGGAGL